MRKRIYISGPMSKGDKVQNLSQALKAYRSLMQIGFAPLCPHLSFFAEPFVTQSHQDWLEADLPWVYVSDAVLLLPGKSTGAEMEVDFAKKAGIPVFQSISNLCEFFGVNELCQTF